MDTSNALAYAGISMVGGDLIYDGAKISADTIKGTAKFLGDAYINNLHSIDRIEKVYGNKKQQSLQKGSDITTRRKIDSYGEMRKALLQ